MLHAVEYNTMLIDSLTLPEQAFPGVSQTATHLQHRRRLDLPLGARPHLARPKVLQKDVGVSCEDTDLGQPAQVHLTRSGTAPSNFPCSTQLNTARQKGRYGAVMLWSGETPLPT